MIIGRFVVSGDTYSAFLREVLIRMKILRISMIWAIMRRISDEDIVLG